jgi:6,7-dimethyl-8-ribityllumazine synthase
MRFGIVASRFNPEVTTRLQASCVRTLRRAGLAARDIRTAWVPGAYEIPWAVQEMALSRRHDVVIAIGCVLKGETPQNDHIAAACALSLQEVALKTRIPCVFGIITPKNHSQAMARTKGEMDRGKEAAEVALALAKLRKGFRNV